MWFMHSGGPPQLKHQKSADMKYLADNFQDNCQGWNFSNCKGLDFSGCQGRFFIANWPRVVQSIKSYSSDKSKMPRSHKLYLALLNLICNKKLWWDNHLHQYKDTIYCIYTILSSCEYIHINYKIVIYYTCQKYSHAVIFIFHCFRYMIFTNQTCEIFFLLQVYEEGIYTVYLHFTLNIGFHFQYFRIVRWIRGGGIDCTGF